ncbi:MAG: hypothetical protein WCA79_01185 [Anaerolineales bacterium]
MVHIIGAGQSPAEVSLREAMRRGEPLEQYFHRAVLSKPKPHDLIITEPAGARRGMSQIGG